MLMSGLST